MAIKISTERGREVQMRKVKIVSTKTFDLLDLDELDDELNDLGFVVDYDFCEDGLLKMTIVSKDNLFLQVESGNTR